MACSSSPSSSCLLLGVLLLLLLSASTAAGALTRPSLRSRVNQLARLLNEGPPVYMTKTGCSTLPADFSSGGWSEKAECGSLWYWEGNTAWPTAEGMCTIASTASSSPMDFAGAQSHCDNTNVPSTLWAPLTDAERCIMTQNSEGNTNMFWTGITDSANEGTWVDMDGNVVPSEYITWAAGQPDGGSAENCVTFVGNEASDVDCTVELHVSHALCFFRPTS